MSNADGVLDQIDHVLNDWDTSDDAMRWTAQPRPQEADPDRCEGCVEGIAHKCLDGRMVACESRCPGCIFCPRPDED